MKTLLILQMQIQTHASAHRLTHTLIHSLAESKLSLKELNDCTETKKNPRNNL